MKHLIIPTDFSLLSLEPTRAAITHFVGEPITITLLHLLEPPSDIIGGLRIAYRGGNWPEVPRAFMLAMESIAAVHAGHIGAIKVKTCYGSTAPAVRNLLEHLGADAIVFNPAMSFGLPSSASFDARSVLRRAMPRHILEVGATPVRQATIPMQARREQPMRMPSNAARLQLAMHDAGPSLSTR